MNPPHVNPTDRRSAKRRRRAMTMVELLLAMVLVAGCLGGLVLTSNSLRSGYAQRQTRATLVSLAQALTAYQAANHAWPPPPTDAALTALARDPASSVFLGSVPIARDAAGQSILRDGYGRTIRYVAADGAQRRADFVSPGPDGRFGDTSLDNPGEPGSARGQADDLFASEVEPTPP